MGGYRIKKSRAVQASGLDKIKAAMRAWRPDVIAGSGLAMSLLPVVLTS